MPNWSEPMQQFFEYYVVDTVTWKDSKKLNSVKSSSITRDSGAETLGSASFDVDESLDECYIRIYLITIQNEVKEKHPLGTYLVQTPSSGYDGKKRTASMDAYTPLIELKENQPPLGFSVEKDANIMYNAYLLVRENARAPVYETKRSDTLYDDFVAEPSETWLAYISALMANAKYKFDIDELGRILFAPDQDTASLQPVWTYNDDNSSILYPDITIDRDLYSMPNVVEVVYSSGGDSYYARVVNDDVNSPISTINRGREIVYRVSNPEGMGNPTQLMIEEYANRLLKELSSLECTISYSHGYCPVRVGDCVRINYTRAGINNLKAKVVSQSIDCRPGCQVTEKAVFKNTLWGR